MSSLRKTSAVKIIANKPDGQLIEKTINFVSDGYTVFFNGQHLFTQLTREQRAFFDYLCEAMRKEDNTVLIDGDIKEKYKNHISEITSNKINPSLASVGKYVTVFNKLHLLILIGSPNSTLYCVNPKYVFKGSEKSRKTLLKKMIEERIKEGMPIVGLVNEKQSKFLNSVKK